MQSSLFHFVATFPRAAQYRNGPHPQSICETAPPFRPFPYSERHIQCLWADPRLRPPLLTTTLDEPVIIEHPGEWNLEAGPDFRNAVLLIGHEKRRICGDLEIHIHPAGWQQHGHANDPRYENVRFHIVYFSGKEIPGLIQIPLQDPLAVNPSFSFDLIDLSAYPYALPIGTFPLKNMHPDAKTDLLESAGEERLRLKTERIALEIQTKDPRQVLWSELMAALGYKNNKIAFRKLAAHLPLNRLRNLASNPSEAYALLLGSSGLLPANPDADWPPDTRLFIRTIWDIWWKQSHELQETALEKSDWNLSGIRPANHPLRRLMAAAHYAFTLSEIETHNAALTNLPGSFWNTHLSWKKRSASAAIVGQSRANAIITNVLVPYRAATGASSIDLKKFPAEPANSIIRQTAHALFGPDHTSKTYSSALARQGLIQIFHDYLIPHKLAELNEKFA